MSPIFKHKYMEGLLLLLKNKGLAMDATLRQTLYNKAWVVYAKQPFGGPAQVIEYLGRYSHKVAISNHRIKSIDNGKVTFSYKDYADGSKQKLMVLDGEEFLRRFCLHILPKGFRKIRHYGFLSSRCRPRLKMQQMQMGIVPQQKVKQDWKIITKEKLHFDVEQCPCCKTGKMITLLSFGANGPPCDMMAQWKTQQQKTNG